MKKLFIFLILVITITAIGGVLAYSYYQSRLDASLPVTEVKVITINPGTSVSQISDQLETDGIIENDRVVELYLRLNPELASGIKAGNFAIEPGTTIKSLVAMLQDPSANRDDVSILIQEGLRYDEVANILSETYVQIPESKFSKSEYLRMVENPDSQNFSSGVQTFLKTYKPDGKNLEGFLYPETYFFAKDATAKEILETQIATLEDSLNEEDYTAIENNGYDYYEVLTVASMIEREAFTSDEKPQIADVIYKRLENGVLGVKLLQIDATILYQAKDWKGNVFLLKNEDGPYNTYTRTGLPPTPISNPGVDSILAAIYPKSNPYYFYLHDSEGNIHFAVTNAEHDSNVSRYINN